LDEKKDGEPIHARINPVGEYFREQVYDHVFKNGTEYSSMESQSKLRKDISSVARELSPNYIELVAKSDRALINIVETALSQSFWIFDDNNESSNFEEIKVGENELLKYMKNASIEEYKKINQLLFGFFVNKIIDVCNEYLNSYFTNVHYIAPLRASAQRYYRLQGLAVDEIDPMGENIPMAINSLSPKEKTRFKVWMKENFGFEIETKIRGGHVTLNISFGKNESLNLADTGFGFSQILPIILLLWRVENNHSSSRTTMSKNLDIQSIVIEQPELHLHPALQARLTDALVNCIEKAKEQGICLNVIIETHSETIINRVGQLVYKNSIPKEQINVLIFGDLENQNHSNSSLHSVSYDEEGTIENWPLGFFYPEE
jgi:predicted ATPase